jgi:rhamnosyltransferase
MGNPSAVSPPGHEVCGILVTYHPDADLVRVLQECVGQLDGLFVWDNSPDELTQSRVRGAVGLAAERSSTGDTGGRVQLFGSGENVGLPVAYNRGLRFVDALGFPYAVILDQDSYLAPGTIRRLRQEFERLDANFPLGAVNARNIDTVHDPLSPKGGLKRLRDDFYEREYARGRLHRDATSREVLTLTNSGMFVRVATALAAGGFDNTLFLDAVDYRFAAQLRARGLRLFQVRDSEIVHRQGEAGRVSIAGRTFGVRTYSPRRTYHLVRDTTLAFRRMVRTFPAVALTVAMSMWIGTLGALILLPRRKERLRMVAHGLGDGLRPDLPTRNTGRVPSGSR